MHVVLGTRQSQSFRVAEFAAYYRSVKQGFEAVVGTDSVAGDPFSPGVSSTYPEPVEHCALCRWEEHCIAQREADDHLSLVARIQRSQRTRLVERGIETVTQLAVAPPADRPKRIGAGTFDSLHAHARLQIDQRHSGELRYELLAPEDGCGFAHLPQPSAGDIFFDMEGDPFFDEGLEYLFGFIYLNYKNQDHFKSFWATDRSSEKQAFEQFIDFLIARLERFPDLHVYHYAPYEATAIKRLMGLHGTREEEVDRLLRGQVLVDLYTVVRRPAIARCWSRSSATTRTTAAPPTYCVNGCSPVATRRSRRSGGRSLGSHHPSRTRRTPRCRRKLTRYTQRSRRASLATQRIATTIRVPAG
jgi:predicted RecB family nuclease